MKNWYFNKSVFWCIAIVGFLLLFLLYLQVNAKELRPLKVAVIDTGYSLQLDASLQTKLCSDGHYDFVEGNNQIGADTIAHGTIVSTIIHLTIKDNYCIVVYKVSGDRNVMKNIQNALRKAIRDRVDIINISLTGNGYNPIEHKLLRIAVKRKIAIFVAAGNDHRNLSEYCYSYPACYDVKGKYYVVGALNVRGLPTYYSNFGAKVNVWRPGDFLSPFITGTSFASPNAAGLYGAEVNRIRKKRHDKKGR